MKEYRCADCGMVIGSECERGAYFFGYGHTDGRDFCTWCYGKYNPKHKPSKKEIKLQQQREKLKPIVESLVKGLNNL